MTTTPNVSRRNFLLGGLALAAAPGLAHGAIAAAPLAASCIVLYLHGGASQLETFDPKPGSKTGGPTRAIATAQDGVRFAAALPLLAARADALAIIRTLSAREGNHDRARYLMRTGHAPQGGVVHPGLAAMVSALHPEPALVGAVSIGPPTQGPGLLGARHAVLPIRDAERGVRNLEPARALAPERSRTRAEVLDGLQQHFAHGRAHGPVDAHGEMLARAREIAGSPRRDAFDLDDESATTRDRYGRGRFGAGCLLARRLVDAEVPFIEVGLPGWDTHEDNFARTATLSAELDRGCAALLDDLRASGRLARTLVVCMGDFGRTPNINARGGRDHWPRSSAVLLAGGGVRPGVIGSTSDDGREIATRPVSVPELYRTIAARLGIDADTQLMSPAGRPITLIDEAAPIAELLPS